MQMCLYTNLAIYEICHSLYDIPHCDDTDFIYTGYVPPLPPQIHYFFRTINTQTENHKNDRMQILWHRQLVSRRHFVWATLFAVSNETSHNSDMIEPHNMNNYHQMTLFIVHHAIYNVA